MASEFLKQMANKQNKPSDFLTAMAENTRARQQQYLDQQPVQQKSTLGNIVKNNLYTTEREAAGVLGATESGIKGYASLFYNSLAKALSGRSNLGIGYSNQLISKTAALNPTASKLQDMATKSLEAPTLSDKYRQNIEERYQPTESVQKMGDITESVGRMIPTIAATAYGGPVAGKVAIGLSAGGAAAQQAKAEGATTEQALTYGLASGALETAIESIASGIPGLPKGVASSFVGKIIKSPIAQKLFDILGEGGEEALSAIITPYLQRATYKPDAKNATPEEIAQDALTGIAVSLITQGASGIANLPSRFRSGQPSTQVDTSKVSQTTQQQNTVAEPPTLTQDESLAQTDIPMPQEQLSQQRATESVREPSKASISEMSKVNAEQRGAAEVISSDSSTGPIIKDGAFVYKNTTRSGWKQNRTTPVPTIEAEVYEALRGNDNILDGELVDYNGEQKIKTPYVKNIIGIDTIAKEKRQSIGKNIVSPNFDGIVNSIMALSEAGYSYSDPLQFAYQGGKLKLMDFSNASKKDVKTATDENYQLLTQFLSDFGLDAYAKIVSDGMRIMSDMQDYSLDEIESGDMLAEPEHISVVQEAARTGVKPNNVYFTRNARMVQPKTTIGQTERNANGIIYVFSEKPLSKSEISEWELTPIYQQQQSVLPQGTDVGSVDVQNAQPQPTMTQPKLPEGMGAMSKYPDVTNEQLIEQYGTVEKGKMPGARDVDLAAQTEAGRTSKFAQTAAESGAVSDEVVQAIKQELPSGSYAYVPTPNKTALAHANETLASKGYETALADFQALMRSNQRVTVRDIVLGERLIQEASRRGDTETAARLIADVAVLGSEYGQATQALNIIKRLSPEGQLMYLQRAVNRMNAKQAGKKLSADDYSELANLRQKLQEAESQLQESRSKGQNTDAATKAIENLKKQINKISGELYIPQSVIDDILAQRGKGEKALQEAMDRAYTAIAEQMPANWYDKWNAWRYMAMLTNPTTHIRNILGNAIFVPVRKLKNTIAAGMESAFNVKERTKAVLTAKDKPLVEFAKGDFAKVEDAITSTGKMNPSNIIRDRRRIFKSNTLETIRTKNSWLLEAEDAIFLRNAYADSLAQYMKANNLTPEFLSSGTEAAEVSLQKARAYAIQEAQKATYRDANAVAKWLNEAKRIKGLGVAIEGVVPFTKPPMNILRRGIEYSPIGLIKGLSYDLAQVKTGAKTATEAIDSIASGMSGTMIMGLGIWLASLGLISGGGSDNDKERAFSDLQGEQNYALQIGDTSYTIDWLAPVALPLFVGVELYNALKSDGLTAAETIEGLSRVADPMLNLTMLQGLNRAIRTAAYSGDNALGALAIESASSYVGQAVPTVLGKVARTIDPVRRDTSATNKDSILPGFVQKAINRNLAKIPFASKTLQPYVDAWGREQVSESVALRLFENFFSPGYISKKETTAVEDELMRLYRANSDRSVLPSLARSSFYDNGTQYTLTSEQFSQFKKTQGQTAYRLLEEAVSSEAYRSLSDDGKAKVVSDIYEYAREKAKEEYFDSRSIKIKRDTAKVVENADGAKKAGLDIVDFLATKLNLQNKKSEPARMYLLQRNDLTASQKAYLDKTLIGERKNPIDYTSEESFYLSQLTENQRNKYARVKQLLGFTAEEYSKYLSVMGKADKKADKINALVEAGLSRQKAAQLYAILN